MSKTKILVVEDERIVAKDIQNSLKMLGYDVPAIASSGEEAIEKAKEVRPDIVLMDIVLKGDIDGIEAAKHINSKFKIPVIYLTAYEDTETLDRAKVTDPLGYILKPFEERDLHTSLEMALYKNKMQRMLTESEERYRRLVELSPDGIAVVIDNRIYYINKAGAELIGETKIEKLHGRSVTDFLDKKTYEMLYERFSKANKHCKQSFIETQLKNVNGLPFDVEIAAIPFPRESETAAQIIFRDISVRKKSEEALKHAYIELKETQEALINSEKLAALGRFAAGVAHEIRNPLANISASAQLLMNNYQVSDEMRRYLEVILRNTDTANQIIKELLDFTSTKEISLAKENINNVIISICDLIKSRCIASNIHLIKDIKEVPDTYINFKKLEQAMLNFASNAIEAMPGGGKLTFRNYYDIKPNEIVIQIADTGHGIEEANIDKVFEPFFTTKDNGTGLGMSLAYHIIKAHKGKLHLESEKDKGTTINISIPVLTH